MSEFWVQWLVGIADESHLGAEDGLSAMVDAAVAGLGLRAEVLVVDLAQRHLGPVHPSRVRSSTWRTPSPGGPTS